MDSLTKPFTVHWTMASANDSISVDPEPVISPDPDLINVPTPAILPMLALGLILMRVYRQK